MLAPDGLSIPQFAHSPYLRGLITGNSRLRFDAELEAQYTSTHLLRVRRRVRVWFTLGVALALFYTVVQLFRAGLESVTFGLQFFCSVPCAVALAWIAWSSKYERLFAPMARVLVPIRGAFLAFFAAQQVGVGRDEALASLTVYVIAAFFFSGLQFQAALFAAAAIIAAFALTTVVFGPVGLVMVSSLIVLLVTGAMGAIVAYDVERSYRKNFLESACIAELVTQDGLTGLMNRRALDDCLLRVWQQAQRDQRTLAVLMVDIDHFKSYNDNHGHQAGDAALIRVAQLLRGFTRRPLDIAARYGGDEFALVLYDMQAFHICELAERIRQVVLGASCGGSVGPGVTVSVGAGIVAPTVGRTPQGALQFADEALYEAKHNGRNCVVVKDVEDYRSAKTGSFRTPA